MFGGISLSPGSLIMHITDSGIQFLGILLATIFMGGLTTYLLRVMYLERRWEARRLEAKIGEMPTGSAKRGPLLGTSFEQDNLKMASAGSASKVRRRWVISKVGDDVCGGPAESVEGGTVASSVCTEKAEDAYGAIPEREEPVASEETSVVRAGDEEKPEPGDSKLASSALPLSEPEADARTQQQLARQKLSVRAELVLWQRGQSWVVGIELSNVEPACSDLELRHGENWLHQEAGRPCWGIEELGGAVTGNLYENQQISLHLPAEGECILFKLSARTPDRGRCVSYPSSGSYVVVCPDSWQRCEELSGAPSIAPEPVHLRHYLAHFFELEPGSGVRIAFRTPDGTTNILERPCTGFELVGDYRVDGGDADDPLFVRELPGVVAADIAEWLGVRRLEVSINGGTSGARTVAFAPVPDQIRQSLLQQIPEANAGEYDIRLLGESSRVVDRLKFRFVGGLYSLGIPGVVPLPEDEAYKPVEVRFQHDENTEVIPGRNREQLLAVTRRDLETTVSIPSEQACDRTSWLLGAKGGPWARCYLCFERIWWGIGNEGKTPDEWTDRALALERADFAASSAKALYVLLPRMRWAKQISVGFSEEREREILVSGLKEIVQVPLREYGEAEELSQIGTPGLYLSVMWEEQKLMSRVAVVSVKGSCVLCGLVTDDETALGHHILDRHEERLFRTLTSQEFDSARRCLPSAVYLCRWCGCRVTSRKGSAPELAIQWHLSKSCPNKDALKLEGEADFAVVSSLQDLCDELKEMRKCIECEEEFLQVREKEMAGHLFQRHRHRAYNII